MTKLLSRLIRFAIPLFTLAPVSAQVTGDYLFQRKTAGAFTSVWLTPNSTDIITFNGSGGLTRIARTTFMTPAQVAAGYQPLNATLTALAALSTTSYGRGFLSLADAAAARTYIGVGAGTGDVVGPASAVDGHIVQFDGTTGKLIKDGLATSTGGNGATDAGKVPLFGAQGEIIASSNNLASITGTASGNAPGVAGETASATAPGVQGYAPNGGPGVLGTGDAGPGVEAASVTGSAFRGSTDTGVGLHVNVTDAGNTTDLAHLHNDANQGLEVANDGGLSWTTSTGAQTSATNLPTFGTATKGVVPASGGGTTTFLRADGTFAAPVTFGTGVQAALGVNVGSAGSIVVNGGALGTPSSGTLTNAAGLPIVAGTTGTLSVARGGTGATTISGAHTNLEIYNSMRVLLNQASTLTNQPNSLDILTSANPGLFISRVNLTNFTEVMFQVHVFTASGSANSPRAILGYSTTYTTTAGSYSDIGTSAVTCSLASTGIIQSGWTPLAAGAKADIYLSCLTNGGNGTADPMIQGVTAFFR